MKVLLDAHILLWWIADGDPFDQLLVAQALVEPVRLLTHEPQLARCSDTAAVV